jgi:DNA repair exonuclease SbcCD nuclease subunit
MPYYILQISDLHIGGRKRELQTFIKIKDFLLNSYDRPKDKTMLIITGDVTNQPNEDFYVNAKENIDQLVNGGFSVWPIPGNHDLCEDGWWFPKSEKIFEKKYIEGNPLLNGFTNTAYPHVKSDGGHHFFALNSMDRDYPGLHFAKGAIGGRQRNELKKKLKTGRRQGGKNIVFLHHHPFDFDHLISRKFGRIREKLIHGMEQGSMLMELLCEQTDILIFGHEHFQCDFSKSSYGKIYNIPVILSCARTTHKCREHSVAFDGKKDVMTKEKNSGRLGWEITMKDNESIATRTIIFPV